MFGRKKFLYVQLGSQLKQRTVRRMVAKINKNKIEIIFCEDEKNFRLDFLRSLAFFINDLLDKIFRPLFGFGVDFANVFADQTNTDHLDTANDPNRARDKGPTSYGLTS